jgi:hypothetical protein
VRELRLWAAAPAAAVGFSALAALRRRRSLHPTGVGYQGQLVVGNDGLGWPGGSVAPSRQRPFCPGSLSRGLACPSRYPTLLAWRSSCPTLTVPAPTKTCC